MNSFLANAGLTDVAFFQGLAALGIAGIGMILGTLGTVYGLLRPKSSGVSAVLGSLGLATILAYAGWFWIVNGDDSWEHAGRYPIFHAVCAGLPFLSSVSAIVVAHFRWRRAVPSA